MSAPGESPAPLMTVREVAEVLRVHPDSVYNGIPGLPVLRVGRRVRVRREDLERYLRGQADDDLPGPAVEAREALLQAAGERVVRILREERVGPMNRIIQRIEVALQELVDEGV